VTTPPNPRDEQTTGAGTPAAAIEGTAPALVEELSKLRRTVLRQGHAQELFHARIEEAVERLTAPAGGAGGAAGEALGEAQVRTLVELDQALLQLLRLAEREASAAAGEQIAEDAPRSLREGLSLLQVRVRNLQHSMGLEAIPAAGRPFDDRWHQACGVVRRPDLPDRQVVEEVLPGYRLGERLVRPATVVVNRLSGAEEDR
jgi:molecular chaperone GrpE